MKITKLPHPCPWPYWICSGCGNEQVQEQDDVTGDHYGFVVLRRACRLCGGSSLLYADSLDLCPKETRLCKLLRGLAVRPRKEA
jgi:hypothetical protein